MRRKEDEGMLACLVASGGPGVTNQSVLRASMRREGRSRMVLSDAQQERRLLDTVVQEVASYA